MYHYYIFGRNGNVRKDGDSELLKDRGGRDDDDDSDNNDKNHSSSDEHDSGELVRSRKRKKPDPSSSKSSGKSEKDRTEVQSSKRPSSSSSSRSTSRKATVVKRKQSMRDSDYIGSSDDTNGSKALVLAHVPSTQVKGRSVRRRRLSGNEPEETEEESSPRAALLSDQRRVKISVDGVPITADSDDMETVYINKAAAKKAFELKLRSMEKNTTVKVMMHYFPFKDGQETLPIPRGYCAPELGEAENAQTPLTARSPGFEVYWVDRLIPNEHLPTLPFTAFRKNKNGEGPPHKCFMRVKGQIFLGSDVSVSSDKLHVTPHDPLWVQLTSQRGGTIANLRENEKQFRDWLKEQHIQFDKEIVYEEVQQDLEDGRTSYERVLIGTVRFKVGDYVQISNKQFRPIGKLATIYCDRKTREGTVDVTNVGLVPVTTLVRVLTKEQYDAKLKEREREKPSCVGLVSKLPEMPVEAGFTVEEDEV